jgi:hypothetical protein
MVQKAVIAVMVALLSGVDLAVVDQAVVLEVGVDLVVDLAECQEEAGLQGAGEFGIRNSDWI